MKTERNRYTDHNLQPDDADLAVLPATVLISESFLIMLNMILHWSVYCI